MTHPNTAAFSAGAVCCPDEASARRHRDRATWWQPEHGEFDEHWRFMILPAERRWTR